MSGAPIPWLEKCCREGKRIVPNLASAMAALRHAREITYCFAFDEMANTAVVLDELPASPDSIESSAPLPHPVGEAEVSQLQEWLQWQGLPRIARDTLHHAVELRALERRFHPVRDYLNALEWDGTKRVEKWLSYYLGAEPSPYVGAVGRMFLVAMVARVMRPGCQADYLLVFDGPQGTGKSSACRILGGEWFSNNLPHLENGKDAAQHLRGRWLVVIEELASLGKAEADSIKHFVTRSHERYRPPYAAKEVTEARQCVFIGTTNRSAYLRDETGGRRFWPVKTGAIDLVALEHDRDQLFAEALELYDAGVAWWPDAEFEREHIVPEQEDRYEADAWEPIVKAYIAERSRVMVSEVAREALFIDLGRIGTGEQRRVAAILQRLGWVSFRSNGVRWYRRA